MRVALFIPCFVDQLKPSVGVASLELLEGLGIEVEFPRDQTCCGQPFLTAGELASARDLARRYVEVFDGFDAIVTPSGSCAATMRRHLPHLVKGSKAEEVARRTRELCEFLVEQGAQRQLQGRFGYRVGLHPSCHALRELRLGTPSESREPETVDPARALLSCLDGLEFVELQRRDECCGFGGTFSIDEEAVACRMGLDRIADHRGAGAQVLTSTDVSCLLHLGGLARRRAIPLRFLHVAEILAEAIHAPIGDRPEATDGSC
jgi:L-lactate dehydrogenase complex protein LldE